MNLLDITNEVTLPNEDNYYQNTTPYYVSRTKLPLYVNQLFNEVIKGYRTRTLERDESYSIDRVSLHTLANLMLKPSDQCLRITNSVK